MLISNHACFDDEALYWLSVSSGVKITQQGFLFLYSPVRIIDNPQPCPRSIGALCQHANNYTFLPCTGAPRTRLTDAPGPFDAFWVMESRCGKVPSLYQFDVTPCDLQYGTSILWSEGVISVQHRLDMDYWPNVATMIIMVWLIINLGESIALILEMNKADSHHHNTVALCVLLLVIVTTNTPSGLWATFSDLIMYWATVAYIGLYAIYHLQNPNTVNVIVGCMMLVAARCYQTNETPYTPTFMIFIATRFVQKSYFGAWRRVPWTTARLFFMCADAALFVMLYVIAFVPSFKEPMQAHIYLTGIAFASWAMGSFAARYVRDKSAT